MCGIFGIYSTSPSKSLISQTLSSLDSLQHRGLYSYGFSYFHNNQITTHKFHGTPDLSFNNQVEINSIIAHVRYPTSNTSEDFIQPISNSQFSVSHNGHLSECQLSQITEDTPKGDTVTKNDTKVIFDYLQKDFPNNLINLLEKTKGVFCLAVLHDNEIYVTRDRYGVRPLCLGIYENSYCFSSETSGLNKFEFYKNVSEGEIYKINNKGIKLFYKSENTYYKPCIFEFLYFSKPTSEIDNIYIKKYRENLSDILAQKEFLFIQNSQKSEYYVVGIPESGILYGMKYAQTLNLEYRQWIRKNINSKRTFIETTEKRQKAAEDKFFFSSHLKDKNIIIVDDTIVRGTVMKVIVRKLKEKGVKSVHVRIPSPPVIGICKYGIDIPDKEKLISYKRDIKEIEKELEVDSLVYLTTEDISFCKGDTKECNSCFTDIPMW